MTNNEAIDQLRQMAEDPQTRVAMQAGWNAVMDQLEPFYLAMRPKPKSFEVHHMNEVARISFARAVIDGHSFAEAAALAVERIKS
jgi:hypothetical protein